jgi:hypothetical protein
MSVAGYIGKNVKELEFPRVGADEEGPKSEVAKGDEEVYQSIADYDPVLRAHCRL